MIVTVIKMIIIMIRFIYILITMNITVLVLPGKPGKPEISALTSTTAKLRWKEGDIGYAPIKKYNIQFAKSGKY